MHFVFNVHLIRSYYQHIMVATWVSHILNLSRNSPPETWQWLQCLTRRQNIAGNSIWGSEIILLRVSASVKLCPIRGFRIFKTFKLSFTFVLRFHSVIFNLKCNSGQNSECPLYKNAAPQESTDRGHYSPPLATPLLRILDRLIPCAITWTQLNEIIFGLPWSAGDVARNSNN